MTQRANMQVKCGSFMTRGWFQIGIVFLTITLLVGATAVYGQVNTATIRGKIIRQGSNSPAARVQVRMKSSANPKTSDGYTVYTDDGGMFYIRSVPFGQYTLQIGDPSNQKAPTYQKSVKHSGYVDVQPITMP